MGGFLGDLGGLLNKVTAPVGIKLAPGGPYADSGLGDVAQSKDAAAQQVYSELANYGRSLLGTKGEQAPFGANGSGSGVLNAGSFGRTPVGANGNAPNAMDQLNNATSLYQGKVTGGLSPLQGEAGKIPGLLQQFASVSGVGNGETDPYGLTGSDLSQFNEEQGAIQHQRQAAESHLKQSLASRGITGGQAFESAMQQLHDTYDQHQNEHSTAYHQNVKANKQAALQSLVSGYGMAGNQQEGQHTNDLNAYQSLINNANQRIGQGTSLIGAQAGGLTNSAGLYQGLGQQASANNQNAWGNAVNLIGGALGRIPTGGGVSGIKDMKDLGF